MAVEASSCADSNCRVSVAFPSKLLFSGMVIAAAETGFPYSPTNTSAASAEWKCKGEDETQEKERIWYAVK